MSLEDWFCFDDAEPGMEIVNMFVGAAPLGFHTQYLVDPTRFDIAAGVAPSTGLACELCAGVATAQALKLALGRGPIEAVPRFLQFDAYTCEFQKATSRKAIGTRRCGSGCSRPTRCSASASARSRRSAPPGA